MKLNRSSFLMLIFVLCILYGMITSFHDGAYTVFQYASWGAFGLVIFLYLISGNQANKITRNQLVAILSILLIYSFSWFLMPHISKFGIFLSATFCFLYTGVILYNSRYTIARVFFVLAFLVSSINLLVLFYYLGENTIVSRDLINMIFITNPAETKEYLFSRFNGYHSLALLIFGSLSAILLIRKRTPVYGIPSKIFLLFIVSFFLSTAYGPIGSVSMEYMSHFKLKDEFKKMVALKSQGEHNAFEIVSDNGPNKIVIIIGESLNREYMSLYGFEKETTPNLRRLSLDSSEGRLVYFEDIISPEVTTVDALQKVLTTVNNRNQESFFNSITMIDLFNKAGYESFWLSNDYPLGEWQTSTSVIANSADSVYFTLYKNTLKAHDIVLDTFYDEVLIEIFNNIIVNSDPYKKQIFFLHIQGSHQNYKDRYPSAFSTFSSPNKNEDSYLNSVLYNDWVINEFIDIAKQNQVAVVAYFSDHGEDIKRGHNPENFTKGMCHIPFMFYLSNHYIELHPKLYENLLKSKATSGMTDNFIHDIQELTGVKASFFDPRLSFFTDSYINKGRYIVNNKILYE